MSGSGRKAIPDVWEWSGGHPEVQNRSGVPSRCPVEVGMPARKSGSGLEAFPEIGSGREAVPKVR